MMKNIKLVGVDLDGTLLKNDKTISEYTVEVMKRVANKGIHIVPITGRPYSGLPSEIKNSDIISYIITSNGAQIISSKGQKRLFSFQLKNDVALKIIGILRGYACMLEIFTDDVGYVEEEVYEYYKAVYADTPIGGYISASRKKIDNIENFLINSQKGCDEIFIICKNKDTRQRIYERFETFDGIQMCRLGDQFLEITKLGTDKGNALITLCHSLDISPKDTIAFGDGENDLQFMEKSGTAVAMENACGAIKAKADIIAPSNEENGVAVILEKLI